MMEGEILEEEEGLDNETSASESAVSLKISRSIRQLGIKRFVDFFRIPVIFDFTPYMAAAFGLHHTPHSRF